MESEERGAPGPRYLRALGFSTTRAQLPQKPHKTRTGGFALRAKKEFTQSSRFAFHFPKVGAFSVSPLGSKHAILVAHGLF